MTAIITIITIMIMLLVILEAHLDKLQEERKTYMFDPQK